MGGFPWVQGAAVADSDQEESQASCEQHDSHVIKAEELLSFRLAGLMEVAILRGPVEKYEADDADTCDDDT